MDYPNRNDDRPVCLECGGEISYGRRDKKFCCERCRNSWNNHKYHSIRAVRLRVLGALDRNYTVLDKLLQLGVHSMAFVDLAQMGYNKEFMTSCQKVGGHEEFRCFDIKYRRSDSRIYRIERVKAVVMPSSASEDP